MKCKRPIRNGESCVVTMFAHHRLVDGQHATDPWLSAVTCFRKDCMTSLTPEVIREARKARLVPTTKREET
jgi:hypothetical protein